MNIVKDKALLMVTIFKREKNDKGETLLKKVTVESQNVSAKEFTNFVQENELKTEVVNKMPEKFQMNKYYILADGERIYYNTII